MPGAALRHCQRHHVGLDVSHPKEQPSSAKIARDARLVLMLAPGWLGSRASVVSVALDDADYLLHGDLVEAGAVCCTGHQLHIAAAP
jgi:hypothetical protein